MNNEQIFKWIETASPGDKITYYKGGSLSRDVNPEADNGLWAIRTLYDAGRIELLQHRLSHGHQKSKFEYFAVMRKTAARIPSGHRFSDYPLRLPMAA